MTTSEFYGPNSVSVLVDKGPTGTRGNNIFVSQGDPNLSLTGSFVNGDLAIDIDTSSATYLFLYRYETRVITGNSITAWYLNLIDNSPQSLIRLIPNSASRNQNTTFVAGQSSVSVQIALPNTFQGDASNLSNSLDIQYTIANNVDNSVTVQNLISSFFVITNTSIVNNVATLDIAFSAVELNNGFWIPLEGQKTVHLVITVV